MTLLRFTITCFSIAVLTACSENSGNKGNITEQLDRVFDGSLESVEQFYSPSQLRAIQQLGLNVNEGDTPPNVEGTFFLSPWVLQASTVPDDQGLIGFEIGAADITISNQNNATLTATLKIDEYLEEERGTTEGSGSFISGSGSLFTIYFKTVTDYGNGELADTSITISGSVTELGIENIQLAAFVIDGRGNDFIPNDSGRVLIDGDGLSERRDPLPPEFNFANVVGNTSIMFKPNP